MPVPTSLKRKLIRELPYTTTRATAVVPDTAQAAIFTVAGGIIGLVDLFGILTVAMDATVTNLSVIANPTTGADLALTAATAVASDPIGQMYSLPDTIGGALNVDGTAAEGQSRVFAIPIGTIDLLTSATQVGSARWIARWFPIEDGATLSAA